MSVNVENGQGGSGIRGKCCETVTFEKGHEGLGIHVRGGTDYPFIKTKDVTDPGIFVVHISDGGYAQSDGRLRVGDKIVAINGVNVERVSRNAFVRLFARATQEEVVLDVFHDAAVKILCGDKRGSVSRPTRNGMDGDHASLTIFEPAEESLIGNTPRENCTIQNESQDCASPALTVPVSTSPSVSLTSGVDGDVGNSESTTSLVSGDDSCARPDSNLDRAIRNLYYNDQYELSRRLGETFLALERVEEVNESIESIEKIYDFMVERNVGVQCPQRENGDGESPVDDAATELAPDEPDIFDEEIIKCETSSVSGSLDSDSDEELRRCRESVCPESHEVTPRTSAVCLTAEGISPTKTDDSSRNSSATPDTVIARATWMVSRSVTPARPINRVVAILEGADPLTGRITPLPDQVMSLETARDEDPSLDKLCDTQIMEGNGAALQGEMTTDVATMDALDEKSESTGDCETVNVDAPNEDAANEDAPNEDAPNEDTPNEDAPNEERTLAVSSEKGPTSPSRLLSPDSLEDVETLRRRLLKQEEDLERKMREEKNADAGYSYAASILCVGGVVALAAVLMTRQWLANNRV